MATSNYSWNLPTVGGSEDAWGTQLNANWTALDTLLGGVTQQEFALLSGQTSLVPAGVIVMWSGSVASIPSGWYICDGTNGTPDLTGRFVVHADADSGGTYAPGDTGGADSVTLTSGQIPSHTHSFSATTASNGSHNHTASTASAGSHTHSFSGSTNTTGAHTHTVSGVATPGSSHDLSNISFNTKLNNTVTTSSAGDHSHTFSGTTGGDGAHTHSVTVNSNGAHTHSVSGTTGATGGGASHENRPPYYALAYIMKA